MNRVLVDIYKGAFGSIFGFDSDMFISCCSFKCL